jgi:hypothetical protein
MTLSDTQISLSVKATLSKVGDLAPVSSMLTWGKSIALSDGTGASQADKIYSDTDTLTASATRDLDLAGALFDILGDALTFAKVKVILLGAADGNANDVVLGGAAATQFVGPFGAATHTVRARPGGFIALGCKDATAWAVGGGASDFLRITNGGAGSSVTYDIVIIGTSV